MPTDEHTLQSKAAPNVFVIGDAANVPASKAGSATHFEGETLVENVARHRLHLTTSSATAHAAAGQNAHPNDRLVAEEAPICRRCEQWW